MTTADCHLRHIACMECAMQVTDWLQTACRAYLLLARTPLQLQLHCRPLASERQHWRVAQRHAAGNVAQAGFEPRAVANQ